MALPPYALEPDAVLKNVSNDIQWRNGIPDYTNAHAFFKKHKSTDHKAGSLEEIVQNLVKNWEKGKLIIKNKNFRFYDDNI
jgi:hypothetical protein